MICPYMALRQDYTGAADMFRAYEPIEMVKTVPRYMIMHYTHIWSYDHVLYPYMVICSEHMSQ